MLVKKVYSFGEEKRGMKGGEDGKVDASEKLVIIGGGKGGKEKVVSEEPATIKEREEGELGVEEGK